MAARDVFGDITQQIIAAIEAGAVEYRMPWHRTGKAVHAPINAISRRPYRGVNTLLLWATAEVRGYASGCWATYQQWSRAGAQVRKGERATAILLWKHVATTRNQDEASEAEGTGIRSALLARIYNVFNAEQVEGLLPPISPIPAAAKRIAGAQAFFDAIKADVRHGGDQACYLPSQDVVRMPHFSQFKSASSYYSVLGHELTHWTGARHRLDRELSARFGTAGYAMEELVAELGAAFLAALLGIECEPRRDHAPYIASWLDVLRGDARAIITAASKAQAAADFLVAAATAPLCPPIQDEMQDKLDVREQALK